MTEGWSAGLYRQKETVQIELEIDRNDKTLQRSIECGRTSNGAIKHIDRGMPGLAVVAGVVFHCVGQTKFSLTIRNEQGHSLAGWENYLVMTSDGAMRGVDIKTCLCREMSPEQGMSSAPITCPKCHSSVSVLPLGKQYAVYPAGCFMILGWIAFFHHLSCPYEYRCRACDHLFAKRSWAGRFGLGLIAVVIVLFLIFFSS